MLKKAKAPYEIDRMLLKVDEIRDLVNINQQDIMNDEKVLADGHPELGMDDREWGRFNRLENGMMATQMANFHLKELRKNIERLKQLEKKDEVVKS